MKLKKGIKFQPTNVKPFNEKDLRLEYINETGCPESGYQRDKFMRTHKEGYEGWLEQELLKRRRKGE